MTIIKPRTATVTILGEDYAERIGQLARAAEDARRREDEQAALREQGDHDNPAQRMGQRSTSTEKPKSVRLAEEHDALVAEAEAEGIKVVVKALGRKVWNALVAAHPPRPDNDEDEAAGVNEDTFKEALVCGGTVTIGGREEPYRSILSPDLSDEDLDALSAVDFDRLYITAFALNRMSGGDPKADLASRMSQQNDETSS